MTLLFFKRRIYQIKLLQICIFIALAFFSLGTNTTPQAPLPSWNDGPVKKSIIDFVTDITNKNSPYYVVPEDRIATFDNDGTLWLEQPFYTQGVFTFDRIRTLAPQHPDWINKPPFSVILKTPRGALAKLPLQAFEVLLAATHSNMTVEQYRQIVKNWLATAKNPRYNRLYTQLIYQPMVEVLNYLRANSFKIYIVTGGGSDFVRAYSPQFYGIPTEQVIGTSGKTKYTYQNNKPVLIKVPEILLIDDKTGKPEAINLFIGKKPIIAFGNSDGDRQMLEWTQSGPGKRLMLLVHHDDAKREYDYGPDSQIGRFSNALMEEAQKNNWKIISMKNDWKIIFPFEKATEH